MPRSSSARSVAQRSSAVVDTRTLEGKISRYHPRDMAGHCVESAREVEAALGSAFVEYVAVVYRDKSREVRNHIAAVGRFEGGDRVVDATWKQFPYLLNPQTNLKSEPLLLVCTIDEWRAMIVDYTPGIHHLLLSQEATEEDAREWMRENRRSLPQTNPVPPGKKQTCTLF